MVWRYNATGVGIMVTALAFLVVGGIIYNNLASTGFISEAQTSTCLTINCPAFGQTNVHPIILCQTNTQCQLAKPSFLNQNSPWTYLLGGDVAGFLASFTNTPSSAGLNALSICTSNQAVNSSTFFHCTSSAWDYVGPPYQQYPLVSCVLRNPATSLNTGFNASTNTAPVTLSNHKVVTLLVVGCTPINAINTNPTNNSAALQILASISGSNGSITLTRYNPGLADLFGGGGNTINILTFLGFLISVILFIMSFGVGFTAGSNVAATGVSGGFSSNAQGTRFIQVIGFGLVMWLPLYSEFGTWIGSLAGWGINVLVTAILLIIFFIGVWTQTTSGTSAA